jgi:hypothetical protein
MSDSVGKPVRKKAASRKDPVPWTMLAQVDPMLFGVGMFRPRKEVSEQKWKQLPPVEVSREYRGAGETLTVTSTRQIGAPELGILLALLAMSGSAVRRKVVEKTDPGFDAITKKLEATGASAEAPHIMLTTTANEVLEQAGLASSGQAYETLWQKLDNLSLVSYRSETLCGNKRRIARPPGSNLLHYDLTEEGPLIVTLSARLTRAILATPFSAIWLPDYRRLSGEVARIIHSRLCVMIDPGTGVRYPLDWFSEAIYGEPIEALSQQRRKDRRRAIRKALSEVTEALPLWRIAVDRNGIICIERHCSTSGTKVQFRGPAVLKWKR